MREMDAIVVVEAEDRSQFQRDLEKYIRLGYVIVHCNSFFTPSEEIGGIEFDGTIRYTAVLQRE